MGDSLSRASGIPQNKPRSGLFFAVTALYWFSVYTYNPTFSPYLKSIGIGYAMIGVIGGAYGFSQMLLRIPLGIWSDRIGKRKIFVVGGVFFAFASTFLLYFTTNPYVIALLRLISGIAASAWVVFTVLFSSYFDGSRSASRISYLQLANTLGIMAAKLTGSFVDSLSGYGASFLLGAAAGFAALILSLFLTENVPEEAERPSVRQLLDAVRDKNLLIMSALAVFSQMLLFATTNTFTPEAASRLGADSAQLGLLATLASVPPIFCSAICGRLFARKVNLRNLMALAFLLETIGTLMVAWAPGVAAICAASVIAGFGFGACMTTTLSFCTLTVDADKRSAAMGFFQAAYSVGLFAGPVLVGAFAERFGMNMGFVAASGISVIGLALSLLLLRTKRAL